jgi:hypothetical protein
MSEFNDDMTFGYEISDAALEASAVMATTMGSQTGAGCDGCSPIRRPRPAPSPSPRRN